MNPFRSVGARLGLGLAIVVAAALLLVDLIVVPSLERNLINAKLNQLRDSAPTVGRQLVSTSLFVLDDAIQTSSASANARVVYYKPLSFNPPKLLLFADSNPVTSAEVENDRLALRAFAEDRPTSGTVTEAGERYAEAAYPTFGGPVVLLRASLHDSLRSIHLVRSRLVVAGLIALALSLLVGYVAATIFARRIRRLERAADRIASGDFSEPVTDAGRDELGQLAAAFERMRQRLAQLEHARREFIANASHELRTQLATDLLDLSRLDAGRLSVERDPIDMAMLAETLVHEFRAVARSSGHDLGVDGGGPEATALGAEDRALQIGRILVENAIVHTPPGTPIRLGTARRNGSVLLTVEDEGPGIPAEHAGQVFDRFYRIEGSVASGSGLGLAIARELAELMGGSIELHAISSRTIFALVLPTAMSEADISWENERLKEPSLQ